MDSDSRDKGPGGRAGNVILLRDGTDVMTENENEGGMFDQSLDEDKDLESQVQKGQGKREETPGPSTAKTQEGANGHSNGSNKTKEAEAGTGSGETVEEPKMKAASDSV